MNSPLISPSSVSSPVRNRRFSRLLVVVAGLACSSALFAQPDPNDPAAGRNRRGGQNGGAADAGGFGGRGGGRGNPEEMQQRMSAQLREQFEVTDDAEWKLIYDRITAVNEARQAAGTVGGGGMAGMAGFAGGGRGGAGGPGGGGRGGRGGGNVELTSLRQAITDKLPEAEIKSRLERLRDSRKSGEDRLVKAQEDLRALLSVRQEAVAVMSGLLP